MMSHAGTLRRPLFVAVACVVGSVLAALVVFIATPTPAGNDCVSGAGTGSPAVDAQRTAPPDELASPPKGPLYRPPAEFWLQRSWRSVFDYCRDPPACVEHGPQTDANRTIFVGLQRRVRVGETFEFAILARDSNGQSRRCGGDSFQIEITGPSIYVGHPRDNFDGTYSFSARLFDEGVYSVRARLDYRACGSSTRCEISARTILIDWIVGGEDGRAVEVVVESPRDSDVAAAGTVAHARGPCGLEYSRWATYDDPSLRIGRWRTRKDACAEPKLMNTRRCILFPESPYVWDPLLRRPAVVGEPPSEPLETLALLAKLRNVWVHSIGDSLARNLHLYMMRDLKALGVLGPFNWTCYHIRDPTLAPNPALPTVVENECSPPLLAHIPLLFICEFPETNVTLSFSIFHEQLEETIYVPWRDGFTPWTDPAFLAHLAPPSDSDLARSANEFNATFFDDDNYPLPAANVRATRSFNRPPFVRNGKPALPTHVFINVGLHYVYPLSWLEKYGELLESVVSLLRRDFPPANTVVVWKSTAQTQYWERMLPVAHKCRTFSRVAHLNEVAAEIIQRNGIPVVDYLQFSLGRPDACPDNRHYSDAVQLEIARETFDIVAHCVPTNTTVPPPSPE